MTNATETFSNSVPIPLPKTADPGRRHRGDAGRDQDLQFRICSSG
ncbi:MAG: hypothetical protein ACJASK_002481, partial [Ilumatobacter sp.]